MRRISVLTGSDIESSKAFVTITGETKFLSGQNIINPLFKSLIEEGGETFFQYIEWLGISRETRFLTLSSRHHFYYDLTDLKEVRMLINLKKLNLIKHLDSFLHIVFGLLPPEANFIGCFSDSKNSRRNGSQVIESSFLYNRVINFLDSRTDRHLSKIEVSTLLDSNGFRVMNMTEINGLTYFTSKNMRGAAANTITD